ncbi:MAG: DUF5691 domain-containing protein [Caldilineaceae bacterium]
MSTWQQLIQQGVLGTGRQPTPPNLDPRLAQLLQAHDGLPSVTDTEQRFLQMAALLAQYELGGRLPEKVAVASLKCQPAPPDTIPVAGDRAAVLLRQIVADYDQKLVTEWLAQGAKQRICLPADLLPSLLERAAKERALAQALPACLGERGRWLMACNPTWQLTTAERIDSASWQTGSIEARVSYLQSLREHDPVAAHDALAAVWRSEAAADRAACLATLRSALSPADVPFLEEALQDRSQQVRVEAARLLAMLPSTTLHQTLATQLTTYITN